MNEVNNHMSHATKSEGETQAQVTVELQVSAATKQKRTLTEESLMERIVSKSNLNKAYRRVKSNKGSPGMDGLSVKEMKRWIVSNKENLLNTLLSGDYKPKPVLGVKIPKPGGGVRQLGIPTVIDRLVQQAIVQEIEPIFDKGFSESSYGFRKGRNAHQALKKSSRYVSEGRDIVVDIDLEKFFDRVNHDIIMSRLAKVIKDKKLLRIIRRFLESGIMVNGVCIDRYEGTPQGGPLSPLLSNILLDDLDKELEKRGHKFCRYADDCNIYVESWKSAKRVMKSITHFLETKLKLKVNQKKSTVAKTWTRKFLGYALGREGRLLVAKQSVERVKKTIRSVTNRRRGVSIDQVISELNTRLIGWIYYFRYAEMKQTVTRLDEWTRRRIRCIKLQQLKRTKTIADFLIHEGVKVSSAWKLALSGKKWWRKAISPQMHRAMSNAWFEREGLMSLRKRYLLVKD
jgi:RNA-directed DNA polymerase